jgi:hypothetical protein
LNIKQTFRIKGDNIPTKLGPLTTPGGVSKVEIRDYWIEEPSWVNISQTFRI